MSLAFPAYQWIRVIQISCSLPNEEYSVDGSFLCSSVFSLDSSMICQGLTNVSEGKWIPAVRPVCSCSSLGFEAGLKQRRFQVVLKSRFATRPDRQASSNDKQSSVILLAWFPLFEMLTACAVLLYLFLFF